MITVRAPVSGLTILHVDVELAANERLDPRLHGLDRKFQGAKQIVGIGNGKCRLVIGDGPLDQGLDRQRTLKQRIGRVHPQMHEIGPIADLTISSLLSTLPRLLGPRRQIGQQFRRFAFPCH